jgi:hypothetical protein
MKNIFAISVIFVFLFVACGVPVDDNKNNKTSLTIINLVYGQFKLTYDDIVFDFPYNLTSNEITKEVKTGLNYIYINDFLFEDIMNDLKIPGEIIYRTAELITCEKDKNNQFTFTENTVVTVKYKDLGEITDTMKNVRNTVVPYLKKEARGFNEIQTRFFDFIQDFNNAPDNTTHTIILTDSFEFPASELYYPMINEGKNKRIIIQGDTIVRTITNNEKTFTGKYQRDEGGSLFVIPDGITLEIGKNIVLNGNNINNPVIFVKGNGTFIMNDNSKITDSSGGGVENYGSFTMNGGIISNNKTYSMGGGVSVKGGTFDMKGGTISGNIANNPDYITYGGGVYVDSGSSFIKTGGTIDNTNSADYGKVAYVENGYKIRETTAGQMDNLDSSKTGSTGGWE